MKRKIPVILEPAEVEKLIRQPNPRVPSGLRNKAILSLVWDCGARVSEVINLRPSDLKINDRTVLIKSGKRDIDRWLSFSERTAMLLKKYKEKRPKGKYFFCTLQGKKLSRIYLYSMIRRYAERCGINKKIGLHTLRHSFALNFYRQSNHDLIRLQKILGHLSLSTTQIYCYMDSSDVKEGLKDFYEKRDKERTEEDRIKFLERELEKLKKAQG